MDLNWIAKAQEGIQIVVGLIFAFCTVCTALSGVLGFLGSAFGWQGAKVWGPKVSRFGITLHDFGEWVGSFVGKGTPPGAQGQGPFRGNAAPPPPPPATPRNLRIGLGLAWIAAAVLVVGFLVRPTVRVTRGRVAVVSMSEEGCTPQAKNVETTILTEAQKGCIWLEELAPAFGMPQPTLQDLETICKVDQDLTPAILTTINDFQANQATVQAMMAQHDAALKSMSQPVPVVPLGEKKR